MENSKIKSVFSLIISIILSAALLGSSYLVSNTYLKSKTINNGKITVTGSAKQQIRSDYAVWTGSFSVQSKSLPDAYSIVKKNLPIVLSYLKNKGIPDDAVSVMSVNTIMNYSKTQFGIDNSNVESYKLIQSIQIKFNDVDKIMAISRESTELIDKGVEFQSQPPQFFYTKLADLKKDMLALATKDAAERADQIASNSGANVVGMLTSKMGVFQITPLYSNTISDYGINDTTSIDKEIMAVMNCEFKTK